jgi:hypothetical protein
MYLKKQKNTIPALGRWMQTACACVGGPAKFIGVHVQEARVWRKEVPAIYAAVLAPVLIAPYLEPAFSRNGS